MILRAQTIALPVLPVFLMMLCRTPEIGLALSLIGNRYPVAIMTWSAVAGGRATATQIRGVGKRLDVDSPMTFRGLYRRFDVVRRLSESELVIYRCVELIGCGGYVVQSADRLRTPFQADDAEAMEQQFWQLMAESPPEERSAPSQSIEQAIDAFEEYFK